MDKRQRIDGRAAIVSNEIIRVTEFVNSQPVPPKGSNQKVETPKYKTTQSDTGSFGLGYTAYGIRND